MGRDSARARLLQPSSFLQTDYPPPLFLPHSIDGVGIGYYTSTLSQFDVAVSGPRPTVFRSVRPPLNNASLRSVCNNTQTTCLFSHIRMAESAVTETNSHPFNFGTRHRPPPPLPFPPSRR